MKDGLILCEIDSRSSSGLPAGWPLRSDQLGPVISCGSALRDGCQNGFRQASGGREIPWHENPADYTDQERETISAYHQWYKEQLVGTLQEVRRLVKSRKDVPLIYNINNPRYRRLRRRTDCGAALRLRHRPGESPLGELSLLGHPENTSENSQTSRTHQEHPALCREWRRAVSERCDLALRAGWRTTGPLRTGRPAVYPPRATWGGIGRGPEQLPQYDRRSQRPLSLIANLTQYDNRRVLHLLNWTGDAENEANYLPPVENVTVRMIIPDGQQVRRVSTVLAAPFRHRQSGQELEVHLPRVEAYQAVTVELDGQ